MSFGTPATAALPYSITGTANQFISTRFDITDELAGKERWEHKFFTKIKENGHSNMKQPSQIEAGHQFVVNAVELKVWQRLGIENRDGLVVPESTTFYQDVIQTLFAYGALRFRKSGIDQIGEYPLRKFIPNITSNSRIQTINPVLIDLTSSVNVEAVSNNAGGSYLAAVPKAMPIILPEQQNFSVDLFGAIPQEMWDAERQRHVAIEGNGEERMKRLPNGLVVAINLWGVETSLQG